MRTTRAAFNHFIGISAVAAVAAAQTPLRALVFDKHAPTSVEPYAAADSMLRGLGPRLGFAITVTEDSNRINDDTLALYAVVVWNNVMRNVLSAQQQQAFQRYMENGGGYVGLHAAATNRRLWPWYVDDFLGGDNHDSASIAWGTTLVYADTIARAGHDLGAGHPILRGVPARLPQYGEYYDWNPNPADNPAVMVLQWYQPRSIVAAWPQALPISWCREYGSGPRKGRLFYTEISHVDSVYQAGWYRTMIGNALLWTARADGTDGTVPAIRKAGRAPGEGRSVFRADGRRATSSRSAAEPEGGLRRATAPARPAG